jgi:hypothetical protein
VHESQVKEEIKCSTAHHFIAQASLVDRQC